jgi:hypothetical protein
MNFNNEYKEIIDRARMLEPNFDDMTTQRQYEFIVNNVDKGMIKEELIFYYDSKFGWPYNSINWNRIYK